MKKIVLLFTSVITILLISACNISAANATQAPTQPAATQDPSSQSNPTSASAGTEVDVTLADNTIQASQSTFQVGVPYTFVIKNTGRHAHNFNINTPVSVVGDLDAALSTALLAVPQEQLGVGQTATVQFTFPDSAAGAQLEFSCLIRRHYEDGMKLAITVTK